MVCFALKQKSGKVDSFGHQCIYEDTKDFVQWCPNCQMHGGITACNAMPLTYNLQVELFNVWGIDYMGPFPKSHNYECILVIVDYVSKWVEAMPCMAADESTPVRYFTRLSFQGLAHQGW